MQCVPYPDLTRSDGVFNLASHSPYNTISPDLGKFLPLTVSPPLTLFTGPKMYNACETAPDDQHQGTTSSLDSITYYCTSHNSEVYIAQQNITALYY
jgi:hypothetical protein